MSARMLDAALALIARGLPVISVYPVGPDGKTCHCPSGRTCRSAGKHPRGANWQHHPMRTEAEVRAHWEAHPRDNVGIPTGRTSGVFVLDVDGEQGKASYRALREEHGPQPATLLANTGGGGVHLLYRMPEGEKIPNSSGKIGPGLDIRGDNGFIVAAGSVSGKGPYSWANDESIADPSPELLGLARATASQASPAGERGDLDAHNVGPKFTELPEAEQVRIRGWLESAERSEAASLAKAATWPEKRTNDRGNGWEKITADLCARFGALALAPWSPWTMQDAEAAVRRAVPPAIAAMVPLDAKWSQQRHRGVPAKFPEPRASITDLMPAGTPTTATAPAPGGDSGDDKITPAQLVARYALEAFTLHRTPTGEAFAVPRRGEPLAIPLGRDGEGLRKRVRADLYAKDGRVIGAEALTNGLGVLAANADQLQNATPLHLRCSYVPGRVVIDLGQPASARCIVVTSEGWTVAARPPAGVHFRRPSSTAALPDPVAGGDLEGLRSILGFAADSDSWHLVRGWLTVAPLADIPRPLLACTGPAGAGKTNRARAILSVLDPREQLGSSFGRNLDDDRTSASSRYLVGYDNLGAVSDAVSDHIARLVTGESAEKRRNYSDTDVVTVTYRRTGAMTAISLPLLRPDALERVIPLQLERMPSAARSSEARLWSAFDAAHPMLLGALCDGLVRVLRELPAILAADPEAPRMKDYALALLALDREAFDAYCRSAQGVLATVAEDDPIVGVVRAWLAEWLQAEGQGATERIVAPAAAYASMQQHARHTSWWPNSVAVLSRTLQKVSGPLAAVGIEFEPDAGRMKTGRRWRFRLTNGGEQL